MASSDHLVTLKGGLVASVEALRILWALEDRGFQIERVDPDKLRVHPVAALTSADVAAIREHKGELLALVRYCTEGVQ